MTIKLKLYRNNLVNWNVYPLENDYFKNALIEDIMKFYTSILKRNW